MAIAQLSIDMVAKIAEFEKDLKRATTATERQTGIMVTALKGLGAAFSVGFVIDFAKRTIDSVDALNDLADATGASVENLSALEDIAARTGTTMDAVSSAMIKFNAALKDAKPDSQQAKAFEALNLDIAELKRLDPAEALLKTATAFATFTDDGNKARIMQELFGKSLKDVAPFLKDLAEKGDLVATVTKQQTAEAEKFNKELFAMQKNVQDLSRDITGPLVSAFNAFLEKQREAKKNGKFGLFTSPIQAELEYNATRYTGSWGDPVGNAGRGNVNPELVRPTMADIGGDSGNGKSKIDPLIKALSVYSDLTAKASGLNADFAEKWEALSLVYGRGKISVDELTDAQKRLLSEQTFSRDLTKEQEESLKETVKALDLARESSARYLESLANDGVSMEISNKALREQIEEIGLTTEGLNQLTLARLDANIAQEQEIVTMASAHGASVEELAIMQRKVDLLKEARALTEKKQGKQLFSDIKKQLDDTSKDYAVELHADVKNALSAAFRESQDPVAAFGDALANVVFTRVTASLTDAMATQLVGSGKSGDMGLIGSLFSSFLPSFAVGTDYVQRDMVARIHKGERIIPAAQNKGGSNGAGQPITVIQNFTVGDVASVSMVKQAVAGSERRIAAGIGRSMSYGGALS